MRRSLLVLIALAAALLAGQRLRWWLSSDATRIRWRLEEMEEGFNRARLGPCLRAVAKDWRDESSGLERALLAEILRALFFSERDPDSGRFRFRVELERETLSIELAAGERGRARVQAVAHFAALERGQWTPTWSVRVRADLAWEDGLGWQVHRSEHETLESDGRLRRER